MSFRKDFRAPPVRLGPHYCAKRRRRAGNLAMQVLATAALGGLLAGLASTEGGRARLAAGPASLVETRARPPRPGDSWPGCNAAREAGSAPLYRGEPGYREEMDGDSDGVACEPWRG
ncbi:excalibur calcium-binding domain-containing protein [Sphingomonas parva]|uniref:excalibur calcium-binding domain-containing protein n=1 Tax=Sphingomonas parva TaxID=2555898 RepID=UPI001CDCCBF4|nr:excalibur calcium-binding domain-containing protein [Sphingomonas parva]